MRRLLLLCLAIVLVQVLLAGHGIEHAFHEHDEACVECLALPGMQAVPAQIRTPVVGRIVVTHTIFAVPPAPTFAQSRAFLSRGPPLLQS